MKIVETFNLSKTFQSGDTEIKAVDSVDFYAKKGTFSVITGSSGSGKSTLLHLIGGLESKTDGTIIVSGEEITAMKRDTLSKFRRDNIGFIFQSYNLISYLNVYENVALPYILRKASIPKKEVLKLLAQVGLSDRGGSYPHQLSGGQQQRVAIARALATKPTLVIADEPTGNLDSKTRKEILGLIMETSSLYGQTVVMVTHDTEISDASSIVWNMKDGKLVLERYE